MSILLKLIFLNLIILLLMINPGLTQSGWVMLNPLPQSIKIDRIFAFDENTAIGMGSYDVWKTTDGGLNWTSILNDTSLWGGYFISGNVGWVLVGGDTILYTTDGGNNWTVQTYGSFEHLYLICFINESIGWVAGSDSILNTTDAGKNWTAQTNITLAPPIWSLHFSDCNNGWLCASHRSLHTTNGGNNWSQLNHSGLHFTSIFFVDSLNGWVVGSECTEQGIILHTTDGGVNWTLQDSIPSIWFWSVHFNDLNTGWVVGDVGIIKHTTDGGITWTEQSSGTYNRLIDVCFINDSTGWIIGDNGTILKTTTGGVVSGMDKNIDIKNIPKSLTLYQNYPNPFNPNTTIQFDLLKSGEVTLKIYNVNGEEVATVMKETLSAGKYRYVWKAENLSSGIYFYQIKARDLICTRKMILIQ